MIALPNKKNLILLAICVVIIIIIASVIYHNNAAKNSNDLVAVVPDQTTSDSSLYGTSTSTEDFANISDTSLMGGSSTSTSATAPLNITDQLSQDIFKNFMAVDQNQGGVSQDAQDLILQSATNKSYLQVNADTYNSSDIKLLNKSTPANTRNYANQLGYIMYTYEVKTGGESDLDIIKKYFETNDASQLKKLKKFVDSYKNILQATLLIGVPDSFISADINYLNSLSLTTTALAKIQNAGNDPLGTLVYLESYMKGVSGIAKSITSFVQEFKNEKIIFKSNEYGSLLNRGV